VALSISGSDYEPQRVAQLAYEGQTVNVILCNDAGSGTTAEDLIADWQEIEVSGDGYSPYSTTVATGSYVSAEGRYEFPTISASFTSTGGPAISYDRVVIYLDGQTYPYCILTEEPNVLILTGQTRIYDIVLKHRIDF